MTDQHKGPSPAGSAAAGLLRGLRVVAREPVQASQDVEARRREFRERLQAARATLEPRIHHELLARIRANPTPSALLLGPSGIGKTSAARWLALGLKLGMGSFKVRASRLGSGPRRHGLGEGDAPDVARARSARVLVLDDLGTEEPRDVGVLQEVIDHRYEEGLPTIATSGLRQDALSAHLGVPYVRRLVEQHVRRRDGSKLPVLIVDLFGGRR